MKETLTINPEEIGEKTPIDGTAEAYKLELEQTAETYADAYRKQSEPVLTGKAGRTGSRQVINKRLEAAKKKARKAAKASRRINRKK